MKTIDGRRFGTRAELAEHSGYSASSLDLFWADRETNGHPEAVLIEGVMHWDVEGWDAWLARFLVARREEARAVDRSGDPDEELAPADQERLLGLAKSAVSRYRKHPPRGWPSPVRTETLPSGRVREFRTRRQLWEYHDVAAGARVGVAGAPAAEGPDPRLQRAVEAVEAQPGRGAGEIAAELAAEYGQSVHTWKPIVTEARKQTGS